MLGKLFKYEFRETAKLLVPLNLILIVMTIIGGFLVSTEILQDDSFILLLIACVMLYALSIFALFIVSGIYLIVRYYKTMYCSQGYLTHTLPVSTSSIVNTKLLVSTFWICVSMVITTLSILTLVGIGIGEELSSLDFVEFAEELKTAFGMGIFEFIVLIVISMILSCFNMVLMVSASMSIGQLCSKANRIIASIGAYFIFNFLQKMSSYAIGMLLGVTNMNFLIEAEESSSMGSFYRGTLWFSIIFTLIYCIGFYITSHYLTNKKLNLE